MSFREDVAWAAGLFEGEGSLSSVLVKGKWRTIRAKINSTDFDVLVRFMKVVGCGSFLDVKKNQPHHKEQWQWQATSFEDVQAVIAMLYPWLGERRRARAKEILELVRENRKNSRTKTYFRRNGK